MADALSDEETLEYLFTKTEIFCGGCGDRLHLTEEIFELRIVQPQVINGELYCHNVLSDSGDLAYDPYYFEFECWENLEEELDEIYEDVPPVQDALGLIECDICRCDIREWEVMGLVRFGELHTADRCPSGEVAHTFTNLGRDKHLCIGCLHHMDDVGEGFWTQGIEALPGKAVCRDGIFERCWRKQNCQCSSRGIKEEQTIRWLSRR